LDYPSDAAAPVRKQLVLDMPGQPDDSTCGPTCLHAVYCYHGDDVWPRFQCQESMIRWPVPHIMIKILT
jgi:hypothetical protein